MPGRPLQWQYLFPLPPIAQIVPLMLGMRDCTKIPIRTHLDRGRKQFSKSCLPCVAARVNAVSTTPVRCFLAIVATTGAAGPFLMNCFRRSVVSFASNPALVLVQIVSTIPNQCRRSNFDVRLLQRLDPCHAPILVSYATTRVDTNSNIVANIVDGRQSISYT